VSGMVGAIGRATTAGALMAVIGVGFGEFARVRMPGWEQGSWYLLGTLAVAAFALAGWPLYRDRDAWVAVAAVFARAADLRQRPGAGDAPERRRELAAAFQLSRAEVFDHRLSARFRRRGRGQRLAEAAGSAEQAAFAAAEAFATGRPSPSTVIDELRRAAIACCAQRLPVITASLTTTMPVARSVPSLALRLRTAARVSTRRTAIIAGVRLSICMAIATAATCALHSESHSFWLPLTVAVAVRPEYASVFVRTINRVAGTAAGALLAAAAIAGLGSGWPVAIAAALSLGFAVLAAPKLYGLAVVGITCSALLSSCIGAADPLNPAVRLIDTFLGCAIAIVFGYLMWPGRANALATLAEPAAAVTAYLRLALRPPGNRPDWDAVRDRAYQLAHQSRRSAEAAVLEPEPARTYAADALPRAVTLETLVDEVTAIADRVDSGAPPPTNEELAELTRRIQVAATPTIAVTN
jgi:uncharacterized membrane protein YccC